MVKEGEPPTGREKDGIVNAGSDRPQRAGPERSSTLVKGMAVFRAFDDARTHMTLAEIAGVTDLDRATVRRLVLTLVQLGYLRRDERRFSLSPRVLTLAGNFLRGNRFGTLVQPLLDRCAVRIGTTVSLAVVDEQAAVYVAQSTTTDSDVTFGFTVGSRLPLLHTAIGRAALAFGDPVWSADVVRDAAFERYTADTTMARDQIARRVADCKVAGYSVVDGEFEAGVTGFAVPVGWPGELCAVIGTSRSTATVRDESVRVTTIDHLRHAAGELDRSGVFSIGGAR